MLKLDCIGILSGSSHSYVKVIRYETGYLLVESNTLDFDDPYELVYTFKENAQALYEMIDRLEWEICWLSHC